MFKDRTFQEQHGRSPCWRGRTQRAGECHPTYSRSPARGWACSVGESIESKCYSWCFPPAVHTVSTH
ncbi:hypothetical protein M9458_015329, partial [Cirrhinus mrigala]